MLHNSQKDFLKRHIGPSDEDQNKMLKELNYKSLDDLIKSTVPEKIQLKDELNIGESNSEYEALRKLKAISKKNQIYSNFIGMGYYGTYTPYVILRNILENPGWYTSYTPYQPEVAQGRLEMLLNFQQMIVDDPSKINEDPEESAWFFKLKIKDKSEMDSLMSKEEYEKFAKESSACLLYTSPSPRD